MGDMGKKKVKKYIVLLSIFFTGSLLFISTLFVHNTVNIKAQAKVTVSDNIIKEEEFVSISEKTVSLNIENTDNKISRTSSSSTNQREEITYLYLYRKHPLDNSPFQVNNMFPGDRETHYFNIQVSYKDKVTVHFKPEIHPGGEKLAEVLGCKVVLVTTGETLYDGLMKDIPDSLTYSLTSSSKKTDELYYQIMTYLDTSVGNEYMNENLEADFQWWVEETNHLQPRPETGYHLYIYLLGALACGILFILTVFSKKCKEGK